MSDPKNGWKHEEAIINGIRLHWVEAGAGPLVVLLHGFPEFWYSWRHQIPALSSPHTVIKFGSAQLTAVAPNQCRARVMNRYF